MKIVFLPASGDHYTDFGITGERYIYGVEYDIDETETVRMRQNGKTVIAKKIDLLLNVIHFKDATTKKNPLYQCSICSEETPTEYHRHPKTGQMMFNNFNDMRLCDSCFKRLETNGKIKIHPNTIEVIK